MNNICKSRSSNFEILRILSMLAIICGHLVSQTEMNVTLSGLNLYFVLFLGSAARVAVSIFLTMGIWFMLDSKFKASRVLNLYGQLIFYTISIFLLLKLLNIPVSFFNTIQCFFPFYSFALWFVSAYIILIFLSPFLNKILEFDRLVLKKFLIVLFIFIPLLSTIWLKMDTKLCVLIYFIYAYLYIGYFKKYLYNKIKINKYILLILACFVYFLLISCLYFYSQNNTKNLIYIIVCNWISDYKSIPNLIISLSIFYFFLNLNIGSNKFINFLSKSVLSTYIIHQTPVFINFLWHNIYNCDYWINTKYVIFYIIFTVVSLYISCVIIDFIRRKFIEPIWIKSNIYLYLENKLNNFYKDI